MRFIKCSLVILFNLIVLIGYSQIDSLTYSDKEQLHRKIIFPIDVQKKEHTGVLMVLAKKDPCTQMFRTSPLFYTNIKLYNVNKKSISDILSDSELSQGMNYLLCFVFITHTLSNMPEINPYNIRSEEFVVLDPIVTSVISPINRSKK